MIVDCQCHVFPDPYRTIVAENSDPTLQYGDGEVVITYGDIQKFHLKDEAYDPDNILKAMDKNGIDTTLLSCNIPGPSMLSLDLQVEGARVINDYLAELQRQSGKRFIGMACLPWSLPGAAVEELDRAVNQLGLYGVMLYSHIGGKPVDDALFTDIYARIASLRVPLVIHPTVPAWGEVIKDYSMITMLGLQVDSSFALMRLILGGVLERYSDLKVVMPHAGGIVPYMMGRIHYQVEDLGRGGEKISRPLSDYFRNIYFDTVSPSIMALEYIYHFVRQYSDTAHLLFGTDNPWVKPGVFVDLINQMNIDEREREKIFAGNAVELFGLYD